MQKTLALRAKSKMLLRIKVPKWLGPSAKVLKSPDNMLAKSTDKRLAKSRDNL